MVAISRVRSVWSGFIGGPGITTMYFLDTATAVASLHSFWTTVAGKLPSGVRIQVQNSGDVLNDVTGELTDTWTAEAVPVVVGAMSDPYSAASGAVIDWLTGGIAGTRRIRGKSFIVPLGGPAYESDGTLATATISLLQNAAEDLIASQSTSFVIWHRGTGDDGTNALVNAARVPDMAAVLKSRRD